MQYTSQFLIILLILYCVSSIHVSSQHSLQHRLSCEEIRSSLCNRPNLSVDSAFKQIIIRFMCNPIHVAVTVQFNSITGFEYEWLNYCVGPEWNHLTPLWVQINTFTYCTKFSYLLIPTATTKSSQFLTNSAHQIFLVWFTKYERCKQ